MVIPAAFFLLHAVFFFTFGAEVSVGAEVGDSVSAEVGDSVGAEVGDSFGP